MKRNSLLSLLASNPHGWGTGPSLEIPTAAYEDDAGNVYDEKGNKIQSWQPPSDGMSLFDVATAPAKFTAGILGAMSPYGETESGESGWRVPPVIQEPINAMNRLADNSVFPDGRLGIPNPQDPQNQQDMTTGLLSLYGGNALNPLARAPVGSVGMFAGRAAKTADHAALGRAEEMAAAGTPREQIWNDTGWFQGVDGQWRFEIDDSAASVSIPRGSMFDDGHRMSKAVSHGDLYAAYPELRDRNISFDGRTDSSAYGVDNGNTFIGIKGRASRPDQLRRSTLHELQHAVQSAEGFSPGSAPQEMLDYVQRAYPDLPERRAQDAAIEAYRRSSGEVESRATEARRHMTAEERQARPPWLDFDVPEGDQIPLMPDSSRTAALFAGRSAKTADHPALAKAEEMASNGASREQIWSETGWFQGADGQWRFEIDDSAATGKGVPWWRRKTKLKSALGSDELNSAYPDIAKIPVSKSRGKAALTAGGYKPYGTGFLGRWRDPASIDYSDLWNAISDEGPRGTLLHEAQHAIQQKEGFARGASTNEYSYRDGWDDNHPVFDHSRSAVTKYADEMMRRDGVSLEEPPSYSQTLKDHPSMTPEQFERFDQERMTWKKKREDYEMRAFDELNKGAYNRSAGEVEARNVVNRMDLTPDQRRAIPPWLTQDMPFDKQMIQYYGEMSPVPGQVPAPFPIDGAASWQKPVSPLAPDEILPPAKVTKNTLFSDTGKPSLLGAALAAQNGISPADYLDAMRGWK